MFDSLLAQMMAIIAGRYLDPILSYDSCYLLYLCSCEELAIGFAYLNVSDRANISLSTKKTIRNMLIRGSCIRNLRSIHKVNLNFLNHFVFPKINSYLLYRVGRKKKVKNVAQNKKNNKSIEQRSLQGDYLFRLGVG